MMVAYNFRKQFVDDVESGKKTQTIREDGKKKSPNIGNELQLYTGMRTKNCRLLRRVKCSSVEIIQIRPHSRHVLVAPPSGSTYEFLTDSCIEKLASDDGFKSVDAFFEYFKTSPGYFNGFLIKWIL